MSIYVNYYVSLQINVWHDMMQYFKPNNANNIKVSTVSYADHAFRQGSCDLQKDFSAFDIC